MNTRETFQESKGARAAKAAFLLFMFLGTFLAALMVSLLARTPAFADETQENGKTVVYSADADAASVEGANFAITNFNRYQAGSNRYNKETLEYYGYGYYLGDELGNVVCVVLTDRVLCYVSIHASALCGFSIDSNVDKENFKAMVMALDKLDDNSHGGNPIPEDAEWIFTDEKQYRLDDAIYNFECELYEGEYWVTVAGADGSDIASRLGSRTLTISQVDAMNFTTEDEVIIKETPTGIYAVAEFLSNLNWTPLWVTLKTTFTAIIFIFVLGLLAGYYSLRIKPKWQNVADTIFTIPMVLPPTVCGFLLLLLCGSNTAFGRFFIDIGFPLVFSWPATVIAAVVVAFPLMYRSARGAFESLDSSMLDAARTLGWSERRIFFKLMLPLSWSNIAAGTVLAFARALGEFGATMFLAGNTLNITRTIPIAIYFEWMNGNTDIALFWTGVILVISFAVVFLINRYGQRTTKYRRRDANSGLDDTLAPKPLSDEESAKPAKPAKKHARRKEVSRGLRN